ncbi:zf-HC2 domain-containing protein [Streptomyces sp. Je 1-369]|uniref:zf-HC2 domain-containing protein n=1 Tax=Streptomyces sp. Je 1-369 TaxID=2966192 RepID=UPI00228639FB|nr:zf-HC2 domain-containing protein [Streptomyces sp. Je 1-369]WAL99368.1 zf-HC2 domain-containing protein [Streptomyces sp. Je 1-369]
MRPLERHRDAGAYALGVLDEADAFRFEDHLMDCPACLLELDGLHTAALQLELYGRATRAPVEPFAAPSPGLLDRLLSRAGRLHGVRCGRRLCAVAVGAVLALGVPAVTLAPKDGPGPVRITARDARGGVSATLTARGRAWGAEIGLTVRDTATHAAGGERVCELVAVATDGSEQSVMSWRVPAPTVRTEGTAALRTAQTDRYEVRTARGEPLLTLRRP